MSESPGLTTRAHYSVQGFLGSIIRSTDSDDLSAREREMTVRNWKAPGNIPVGSHLFVNKPFAGDVFLMGADGWLRLPSG